MLAIKPKFKLEFFDRSIIKKNWRRMNKHPLAKAGLIVRRTARGSIRRGKQKKVPFYDPTEKRKRKPSKPGKPPKSYKPGSTPPFKMIYSLPNDLGTSVIVGMVGFGSPNPIPGLHEHGGSARRRVFVKLDKGRDKKGRFRKARYKAVTKMVKYPERPFMLPALEKTHNKYAHLWKDSLN